MPKSITSASELQAELAGFMGSELYYRHPFHHLMLYSDGIKHLKEVAGNGAYWLLDLLASHFHRDILWKIDRKTVVLTKKGNGLRVEIRDSTKPDDAPCLVSQDVQYSDFPLDPEEPFKFLMDTIPYGEKDRMHQLLYLISEY